MEDLLRLLKAGPYRPAAGGLDGMSRWMVARNLEYVAAEGLAPVLARLRAQGYERVAAAVEAEAGKPAG